MLKRIGLLLLTVWKLCVVNGQDLNKADIVFKDAFDSVNGTFVLYDLEQNNYYYYNEDRANTRYPPMSTFKIPNSLIALETGVLDSANSMIVWDSTKIPCNPDWNFYPVSEWCRDHSLASAFKYSVVWYYQEVARRIGHDRMQEYLNKINYGNNDIDAGIDNFWFRKLKISAKEQIEFLKAFYIEEIDFDPDNIGIVKDIMIIEETDNHVLYGKTGGGAIGDHHTIGWFVGFVETDDNVFFFALNMDGKDFISVRDSREKIAKEILTGLSVL